MTAVPGYPHLRYIGGAAAKPAEQQSSPKLLAGLEAVGRLLGKTIDIFSGSGGPSVRGAGFKGDPHDKAVAVDANIDGRPIGNYPGAVTAIHAQGLRTGATDFTYQGKPDPAHVDLLSAAGTSSTAAGSSTITSPAAFFDAVLKALGAPLTTANRNALKGWAAVEGTKATYNPLATTLDRPGATSFNDHGVRNYTTPEQGVDATAATIRGGYPSILSSLKAGAGFPAVTGGLRADLSKWVSGSSAQSVQGTTYAQLVIQRAHNPGAGPAGFWHDPVIAGAGKAAGAVADAAMAVPNFLASITDTHNILRALQVLGGAVLVLVGLALLTRQVALAADVPVPSPALAAAAAVA